jgi:hypothetical protein
VKRIKRDEGEEFGLERDLVHHLRSTCVRLQSQLQPSFPILTEANGLFRINGIVGTFELGANVLVEVSPKTQPNDDWIHAVLDLLIGSDRIDIAGERAAGLSPNRRNLFEILASIYLARLERAIRRDGPILLMTRQHDTKPLLKGKLQITDWIVTAPWKPHKFPISYNALSVDHVFSQALAQVAQLFAGASHSAHTKGRLRSAARAVRPGCAEVFPGLANRAFPPLPSQWSVYQPAWSIAVAVLSQRFLLRSRGPYQGVSIVIEAWPLLERLLDRSLSAAVKIAALKGKNLQAPLRKKFPILTDPTGSATLGKVVEPDGRIVDTSGTVATFETKYKRRNPERNWPDREDVYQALVAAAACNSPLAVLVYPESFETARWHVVGMNDRPKHLVAIGLGLFSYRMGVGEQERGQRILELLKEGELKDEEIPLKLAI